MELTDMILLALPLVTFPVGYLIGVSHRYYTEVSTWKNNHKSTDISYYQEKIEKQKGGSLINRINYYLGYPGRTLALRKRDRQT